MHVVPPLPILAINDARPTVFKLIVLPPVFGPVMTKTVVSSPIIKSTGTGWSFSSWETCKWAHKLSNETNNNHHSYKTKTNPKFHRIEV